MCMFQVLYVVACFLKVLKQLLSNNYQKTIYMVRFNNIPLTIGYSCLKDRFDKFADDDTSYFGSNSSSEEVPENNEVDQKVLLSPTSRLK